MDADVDVAEGIDGDRLWERLHELAHLGATPGGGVDRPALSGDEIKARARLVAWGGRIGLHPLTDAIGNLFLRLPGQAPDLPPVLVGSHIDSQPTGGKFDGAYGVLAALECLETFVRVGYVPARSIDLVSWTNEEGSRFAPGMMGSAVFGGARALDDVLHVTDREGICVATALAGVRGREMSFPQLPLGRPVHSYLEAHIEQGPILEMRGVPIGIVSGIQGKRVFRVEVRGEENHAGTAPRAARHDALLDAVSAVSALRDAYDDPDDVVRFTVGRFDVRPNAPSVVPGLVEFSVDLRHPVAGPLSALGDALAGICQTACGRCAVAVRELSHDAPLEFPTHMRDLLRGLAGELGLASIDLPSGAGHDARHLHAHCPTGMIFIPCAGGLSHSEAESITKEDAADGARLLARALQVLSG